MHILLAKSYMRLAGGKFAEIERSGGGQEQAGENGTVNDATGFVAKLVAAGGAAGDRAKANGVPVYGHGFERAIAHHLAIAIDLDPRSVRTIRAMGEGAHAALQSAAKKGGIFDPSGMASMSVSLNDASTSQFLVDNSTSNTRGLHVHHDPAGEGDSPARYEEPDEDGNDASREHEEDEGDEDEEHADAEEEAEDVDEDMENQENPEGQEEDAEDMREETQGQQSLDEDMSMEL